MPPENNIRFASSAGLTRAGRWGFAHRRFALFLILAVGLTTPVLLALNWDHNFFHHSELASTDCLSGGSRQLLPRSGRHPLSHAKKNSLADD